MNNHSEAVLVKKLAKGDELAFAQIYDRHRDRVYGFVYRMTVNRAIAEDIAHETFMFLIENPGRYDARRSSILTFLCAIARNRVMNHLRKKHNGDISVDEIEARTPIEDGTNIGPLAGLLNRELASQIDAGITALPPLLREVIILREFQELSYEEIAKVTEAEIGAVKTRLHRARQALARELAAYVKPAGKDNCNELYRNKKRDRSIAG
jgi:RNA polymerase sigma-70 factor, ECF subfamily